MTISLSGIASPPARETGFQFETLNGMRGMAALLVVIFHLGQRGFIVQHLPGAYFCVDFFFMLSGFVLAYRHDDALRAGRGRARFLGARLLRLYPLYALGLAIGAVLALLIGHSWRGGEATLDWLAALGLGLVMLPYLTGAHVFAFPFNPPTWSLFYEMAANTLHAALGPWLGGRLLVAIVLLAGGSLIILCVVLGTLNFSGATDSFAGGALRVAFSYFGGVGLYRLHRTGHLPTVGLPPVLPIIGLVAVMALAVDGPLTWIVPLAILPALLWLGIGSRYAAATGRVMGYAGLLSFPLYAVHDPLLFAAQCVAAKYRLDAQSTLALAVLGVVIGALFAAHLFDAPLHRRFRAFARRSRAHPVQARRDATRV